MRYVWFVLSAAMLVSCGGSAKAPARQATAIADKTVGAARAALLLPGQSAQLGNVRVTFTGATVLPERQNSSTVARKQPGVEWLAVTFSLTNTGQMRLITSTLSVRIGRIANALLTYNNVYQVTELLPADLYPEVGRRLDADLAPGETVTGTYVASVRIDEAPWAVRWDAFTVPAHADWAVPVTP